MNKPTQAAFHIPPLVRLLKPPILRLPDASELRRQRLDRENERRAAWIHETLAELSRRPEDVCVSSGQEMERLGREREEIQP